MSEGDRADPDGRQPVRGRAGGFRATSALVAVAFLGSCGTASSIGASSPPSPAASVPAATSSVVSVSPVPGSPDADFRVRSMTFVSDDRGFALGTVGCGPRRCLALVGTADGGRRWRRLTAPTRAAGAVYDTCPHGLPCVG